MARAVQEWSREECWHLIDRLAHLPGGEVPSNLEPVRQCLDPISRPGMDVLATSKRLNECAGAGPTPAMPAFYDWDAHIGDALRDPHLPWVIVPCGGRVTLAPVRPQNVPEELWTPARIERWLRRVIEGSEIVPGLISIGKGGSLRCVLDPMDSMRLREGVVKRSDWLKSRACPYRETCL